MAEIDVTRIAGNIGAMNALNALKGINKQLAIHQTRLSSGKRINSAADDPAGLSIATKMLSRSEGLKVALSNIGDAKNLLAVAESGMGRINDILVQMRNKAETGASDTMGDEERLAIKTQLDAYAAQINDLSTQTKWNKIVLLDGSMSSLRLQTGVDSSDSTTLENIGNMSIDGPVINIATKVDTSFVNTTGGIDHDANVTASFDANAKFSWMDELETGTYKLSYSYDSTAKTVTYQLKDAATGEPVEIDADGVAGTEFTTTGSTTVDCDLSGVGGGSIYVGNGLKLTFAQTAVDIAATNLSTIEYNKTGTLSLKLGAGKAADYAAFMDTVQTAIDQVNQKMSSIGALTGRLSFKEDQVSAAQINIEAAYNRIMNADMAEEQVEASKYQILQQTATAMLAQANAAPQFLLSLFQ